METPPIRFYRVSEPNGFLSNFSPHSVTVDGREWLTAEHYFQSQKFVGTGHEEAVAATATPWEAAQAGRSRTVRIRTDWWAVRDDVMRRALQAKFTQHDDLREALLATGDLLLVEHTSNDRYWGDGGDGTGRNRLGELLQELRASLREG